MEKKKQIGPALYVSEYSSKERLLDLAHLLPITVPKGLDPSETSWVLDNLGVTAADGVNGALNEGAYVINVAEEIANNANIKIPVVPYSGLVRKALDNISDHISEVMDMDRDCKVVVHCAMGMERSVLAVVWHMQKLNGFTLDDCYKLVRDVRPIALDRRKWINS